MAAVSADGSTVCVLIRRLNSSCNRSIAFVVRTLRHWLGGRRAKVKSRSPASSRLSATARCLSLHLRMKAFPIEPHAHHGAVENEPYDRFLGQRAGVPGVPVALYLAPDPADTVSYTHLKLPTNR